MARSFPGSTNTDRIYFSTHTFSTAVSISIWLYINAYDTTFRRAWHFGEGVADNRDRLAILNDGTRDELYTEFYWDTNLGTWTCAGPLIGGWHHVLVTYNGASTANDAIIYIDGTSQTITEETTPSGSLLAGDQDIWIGNREDLARCFNGYLAEYARWGAILTQAEATILSKGFSPLFVNLGNLNHYIPIIGRKSPETDIMTATTGTVTNTTNVTHPRIIYPSSAQVRRFTTAVAAAGGGIEDWPVMTGNKFSGWRYS